MAVLPATTRQLNVRLSGSKLTRSPWIGEASWHSITHGCPASNAGAAWWRHAIGALGHCQASGSLVNNVGNGVEAPELADAKKDMPGLSAVGSDHFTDGCDE